MALIQASGPGPQYANNTLLQATSVPASGPGRQYQNNTLYSKPTYNGQVQGASTGPSAPSVGAPAGQPGPTANVIQGPDTGIFDSIIAPALQALEGQIDPANSAYSANVAGINSQVDSQKGKVNLNLQQGQTNLTNRQTQAEGETQNAVNEARRGYSEMSQGIQARYGGTTGTGAFADSILGGQTQRNIAGYRNQLAQNVQQLQSTGQQIKQVAEQALQDLESNRMTALQTAKSQLDQTIANIRSKQGELQSQKAQWTADAIGQYRQQVNQANLLDQQYKQQLYQQQQAAEQRISGALTTTQQKLSNVYSLVKGPAGDTIGVFNQQTGQTSPYNGPSSGGFLLPNQKDTQTSAPSAGLVKTPQTDIYEKFKQDNGF